MEIFQAKPRLSVLSLSLIGILLVAGCTATNVETFLKASPAINSFLSQYPNAKITTSLISQGAVVAQLEEIKKDCEDFQMGSYYKSILTDEASNTKLTVWMNAADYQIVCIVHEKSGVKTPLSVNETTTSTPITQQTTTTTAAATVITTLPLEATSTTINLNAAESCQDAEGDNVYVFGVSTIKHISGKFSNYSDYCSDSKNLVEYYCNEKSLDIKNVVCDFNCVGGVCPQSGLAGTPICNDTGSGIRLRSGLNYNDTCKDDKNLKDYYCLSADIPAAQIVACQHGCNNAKCNPPPLGPPDISVSYKVFGYNSLTKIITLNYTINVMNSKNETLTFHTISDLFKGGRVEGTPATSCVNQTTATQIEGSYSSLCSISLNETGAYAIRITVDYLNKIAESDESNNVDTSAITVI